MIRLFSVLALLFAVLMVVLAVSTSQSAMTMSERGQISRIKNMEAKFACLAKHSHPVYEHVKSLYLPFGHVEFVTDTNGQPLTEGSFGVDKVFNVTTLTRKKNASSLVEGWLVDNGCFLLPRAPR